MIRSCLVPCSRSSRAFILSPHSVITEDDAERVWASVENAIRLMSEEEDADDDDEYDEEVRIGVEV